MSLKEKLKKFSIMPFSSFFKNDKDFEFEAKLENHPVLEIHSLLGGQEIYRLHYVNYHRIGEGYERNPYNVGVVDSKFEPFMLPDGMERNDAFKVLSYLIDYIEKQLKLEPCAHRGVSTLNNVLDLKRLGFKRVDNDVINDNKDIIDLFTVTGRVLLFKKSKYYPKYFEWYTENVTFEEVKSIYDKCGIDFYDLIFKNNQEEMSTNQEKNKVLKK